MHSNRPQNVNLVDDPSALFEVSHLPPQSSVRLNLTTRITRYLAAQIIAEPDFPKRSKMPLPLPPPFWHFGHQVLMDYPQLVKTVWSVAQEIRSLVEQSTKRLGRTKLYWSISVGASLALTILTLPIESRLFIPFALLSGILWLSRKAVLSGLNDVIKPQIAKVRAKTLQRLINDHYQPPQLNIDIPTDTIGTGTLGSDMLPVITITGNSDPFSGYGRLQADNLFVCRPKEESSRVLSFELLNMRISQTMVNKVGELGLPETTYGEVIVLHGQSLSIRSRWLTADKSPILWLPRGELAQVYQLDPGASVRVYYAAQILLPQYMAAATFFVRLFMAGKAVAFQVAMTTLGPPTATFDEFVKSLLKHNIESENATNQPQSSKVVSDDLTDAEKDGIAYLAFASAMGRSGSSFQADIEDGDKIENLRLTDELVRGSEYQKRFNQIVSQSAVWPGCYVNLAGNWRENHSLTFPADFFGRPECIATVRAVYDQIVRSILDSLDNSGYDISDYRGSDGKYSIQVEKIDQMVVGERVHIGDTKKTNKKAVEAQPAT